MRYAFVEERSDRIRSKTCAIVDTSALLIDNAVQYLQGYYCFTVPKVIEEVKTLRHKAGVEILLDSKALNVVEVARGYLKEVLEVAKKSGDITSLSETDLEVLALTLQLKEEGYDPILITDDYTMQNLASRLRIRCRSIRTKGIEKRIKWRYRCTACGRIYHEFLDKCVICGHELKREVAGHEGL
jgi:UPF0271 protein